MLKHFYDNCIKLKITNNIYIGYSGGIDSSVLLNLCFNVLNKKKYNIRAININYKHNINSNYWDFFCKNECYNYRIPLTTFYINSSIKKNNLEQEFRIIRYKIFLDQLNASTTFLLAHNSSDLIETFFLNLLRGCGMKGILGIKERLFYKNFSIIRPLLFFNKDQIFKYAYEKKINYITDFTNFDIKFSRNFLRFNLFTDIKKKWQNFEIPILRYINLTNYANSYINHRYRFLISKCKKQYNYLNLILIRCLPFNFRKELINFFLKKNNIKPLSYKHFNELNKLINNKKNQNIIKINSYLFCCDNNFFYFKKIKKENIFFLFLKKINLNKSIKNTKVLKIKVNNFFLKNYITKINKKNHFIIKYDDFLIGLLGIWMCKFYYNFLKKKFFLKFLN